MRLIRPTGMAGTSGKRKIIYLAIAAVLVIAGVYFGHKFYVKHKYKATTAQADTLLVNRYKGSSDLNDKRVVISAYTEEGDYNAALPIAEQIADATHSYQDYMAVLSICGLNNVDGKQDCLNKVSTNLKPLAAQMPFSSAYAAGVILEKNGLKKEAAVFYQRAYNTYAPDPKAENMMTKEQLKAKIDELS